MSTIYKIAENLKNTIEGKEALLAKYDKDAIKAEDNVSMAISFARKEFLSINIDELKRILDDVEKACQEYSLQGWEINPERMGR